MHKVGTHVVCEAGCHEGVCVCSRQVRAYMHVCMCGVPCLPIAIALMRLCIRENTVPPVPGLRRRRLEGGVQHICTRITRQRNNRKYVGKHGGCAHDESQPCATRHTPHASHTPHARHTPATRHTSHAPTDTTRTCSPSWLGDLRLRRLQIHSTRASRDVKHTRHAWPEERYDALSFHMPAPQRKCRAARLACRQGNCRPAQVQTHGTAMPLPLPLHYPQVAIYHSSNRTYSDIVLVRALGFQTLPVVDCAVAPRKVHVTRFCQRTRTC